MHVLWVNRAADWIGGAERYVGQVARALRERGARCTLLYDVESRAEPGFVACFDAAFPWVDTRRQVADLNPDVLYVHRLPVERDIARLRTGRSVIRFHHDHRLFCPREHKYTTIRRITCKKPVGLHCYPCLGVVQRSDGPIPLRLRTVGRVRSEQRLHRELDAHVVGSRYMADHLIAHGFDRRRIHVLPPPVEIPADPGPACTRDEKTLLFVGAMLRGKGLDLLLEALTRLPDPVRLIACGEGRNRSALERAAGRLGLTGRVEFRGRVNDRELDRLYRQAGCVIVPSRTPETFGLVGPEALLRGTPVVASRVGGVGEWLTDGVTGHSFPPGDPIALANAILAVLESPEQARRVAERGRARVRSCFTLERHVRALERVLGRLIDGRPTGVAEREGR